MSKKRLEELADESVKARYAHKGKKNPLYVIFARKLMNWRDETGGVTPASLIDIAKELRVHARILDCTGRIFLEHTPETRNTNLKPICATVHGSHCYLYDGEEALRSLTHRGSESLHVCS